MLPIRHRVQIRSTSGKNRLCNMCAKTHIKLITLTIELHVFCIILGKEIFHPLSLENCLMMTILMGCFKIQHFPISRKT